ncbi:hydroxyacylglutathione hydrolase [Rhodanobacter sp. B04]|uniref:hydroxyacylglutathione hydrolase n=1 Tax=Rhodanobacter sp. B04 TaxID=1945860 RepID=UPI0009862177|nr:hydroxyacylglutathione hydrolase [Rhodanobacter sp. B04]OOG62213.1 hydroxyacylglutathione hydrolase [Rhodanobacter sp. B04]
MHLVPLPALVDNYIWLLHDDGGNALVVDPGDAMVVERALAARRLKLRAILLTHHHHDHTGGVSELCGHHAVPVYAPVDERIGEVTVRVHDGDSIELTLPQIHFDVIAIPGHTLSHVAYHGAGVLLCGDTLFSLGCGKLFEGSPAQMLASLDRLSTLPGKTLVCGGHEYTEVNARFARTIDPENPELRQRQQEVAALRAQRLPTLPVALADELAANPFLRVDTDAIAAWCRQRGIHDDRVARFAAVREAKDGFS